MAKKPKSPAPNAFALPSDQIERALLTGESPDLLEDYFGPEAYQQLRDLILHASTRVVRGGPRVLILPGIMGSTLSRKAALGIELNLWLNPIEIALGRLSELKLGGTPSAFHAHGVLLFTYLKLKLRLRIAGFDADFFAYDWRQSVADSGGVLAKTIQDDASGEIHLVAHSMGGLVARSALSNASASKKVRRLVMLGTPNYGSFAVVQALRGTYGVIKNLVQIDRRHNAEFLAGQIFNTFPGLYEMLPAPGKWAAMNLYELASWPSNGPRPRAECLDAVARVQARLAPADARFHLIAGINQSTASGVRMQNGEFVYDVTNEGDGTVPLAFARLDGLAPTQIYYVEEQHGNLPNHGKVESAVIDLLSTGSTQALLASPPPPSRAVATIAEAELRAIQAPAANHRQILEPLAAPLRAAAAAIPEVSLAAAAAEGAGPATISNLVIGRRRQRRLEISLAHGSITEADSKAYVLGVFRSVAPSGAAKAIDERLDGAISEFTARRIFSGGVGELFTLPAARSRLGADLVVFAGLGAFDRFNPDVHQLVAENIIRMFTYSHIDEFATVLIGAGAGQSIPAVVQNLLTGFLRGLRDADPRHRFRGITLCETDPARYAAMKSALLRIAGTSLFDDVELLLDEIELPPPAAGAPALAPGPEPIYAMIRQEGAGKETLHFRISVLGSGSKAAVISLPQAVDTEKLDTVLRRFDGVAGGQTAWEVQEFGAKFAELMLPQDVRDVLASMPDRHLVLVHDAAASRVPWETLAIGDWTPSTNAGLSRRYLADNMPITTWLEQRRSDPVLKLLLIIDPTQDLEGAHREGDRVLKLASAIDGLEVTDLRGERATKPAVLGALRSGKFDIVHYAGHAAFDADAPGRAGLVLAGRDVLTGPDLAGISNLPFLVFFNACRAGRVRGAGKPARGPGASAIAEHSYSVAETLMRGGISNYLSTYWPVRDDAAEAFAATFYQAVLAGRPIGTALLDSRKAVQELGVQDWADYILYGSFDFILKRRNP
jgi:pimeloyl-ACP methyl ester carboxylesterase